MKPALKAYIVNPIDFDQPYFAPTDPVYGETQGKAKVAALSMVLESGCQNYLNEDFTFSTLRIKRAPQYDKFIVDGVFRSAYQIEHDKKIADRKNEMSKLLADNPDGYAYIMKGGYYYKPNNCGYTEYKTYAGVYSLQDAVRSTLSSSLNDYLRPILIDIDEHNSMINSQIESLKNRLINND